MTDSIPTLTVVQAPEEPVSEVKRTRKPRAPKVDPDLQALLTSIGTEVEMWLGKRPLCGGQFAAGSRAYHASEAWRWTHVSEQRDVDDLGGWDDQLLSAAFGALAEEDADRAYSKLVQVAVVALRAAQNLDRKEAA